MNSLRSYEDLVLELCDAAVFRVENTFVWALKNPHWVCSVCGATSNSPVIEHEEDCAVKLVKEKLQEEKV